VEKTGINTKWFLDRLADKDMSARRLALLIGMNPSAMSRTLNGGRKMQMDEAADIARVLGRPFDEVVMHAGIAAPREIRSAVRLNGMASAEGFIGHVGKTAPRTVERPGGTPEDIRGVMIRAPGTVFEGWVAYYVPTARLEPDAVGRLSVVQMADGKKCLRVLVKGFERGKWTLVPLSAGAPLTDVDVEWAAPVLWIRT
jgi:transcriptional regulator with XRE-family HTH domain